MATKYGGYMGKVLKLNLSTMQTGEYPWTDQDRELYLGGKIMAAKILYDNVNAALDPLSEDNIIVFTTGPLTGSGAPSSSRFNISTISPLTGCLTSSNCGGSFGFHLKKAGYDGIVISGKAKKPVWIEITDESIVFHDAADLWGKTTGETQTLLGSKGGKAVIGPAGENLVRYASVFSQERAAGRGGAGAVMGSKNLKAILARGKQKTRLLDKDKTRELNKEWTQQLKNHPMTGKILPQLGTANLLRKMQKHNMLATRNFRYGQFADYDKVSGEYMTENYLVKNNGCLSCPIQCSRVVEFEGRGIKGPELETLGLLGPNIENNNLELIIKWNYLLDELGMDTMSTGGTIAFAMELQEKGLWNCGLEFGKTDNLADVFKDIAYRRGIGDLLAEGTKKLAEKFGGADFAINSKGMELAAYEPRAAKGQGLGYAVANRGGCHINAGYMVFFEGLGLGMDRNTIKSKVALTILMQNLFEAVSAGGNCIFTTYALIPGSLYDFNHSFFSKTANFMLKYSGAIISFINHSPLSLLNFHLPFLYHARALSTLTGMNLSIGRLLEIGERGYNLERLFNLKMNLTSAEDNLPARLTRELQIPGNKKSRVPLEKMKKKYYRQRGWNPDGIPLPQTLARLKLHNKPDSMSKFSPV